MITAVYHRKYNRLTVEGHARSAEAGKDLVCASASMLACTLAANVDGLANNGQVKKPVIKLEEGNAEISCVPKTRYGSVITLIFDTICIGFELLQEKYPEYITYKILG